MLHLIMLAHVLFLGMGAEEGSNTGGFVISSSLPKEPTPSVQSLHSGQGEPIAVIEGSHVEDHLLQLLPLLLARPFRLPG